jgi:hypothetical protein
MSLLQIVAGPPSPLLYATFDVMRALTQVVAGDHKVIVANSLESLANDFPSDRASGSPRTPVVLLTDFPDRQLLDLYRSANVAMIVCASSFLSVSLHGVLDRGMSGIDAARFASTALVRMEALTRKPLLRALVLRDGRRNIADVIREAAELQGLEDIEVAVREAVRHLGYENTPGALLSQHMNRCSQRNTDDRDFGEIAPLERELLEGLAPEYDGLCLDGAEAIEWPPFALVRTEVEAPLSLDPMDLTGPARFVCYGPYFALPEGGWRAELSLEIHDCLSDNDLRIEAFAGRVLAAASARLPAHGVFDLELDFKMTDPTTPFEIRIQLMTGAIEGAVLLRRICFIRQEALERAGA